MRMPAKPTMLNEELLPLPETECRIVDAETGTELQPQGEVGELLRDIAVAISVAVFASLVVSVLVIPSFAARLLHGRGSCGS